MLGWDVVATLTSALCVLKLLHDVFTRPIWSAVGWGACYNFMPTPRGVKGEHVVERALGPEPGIWLCFASALPVCPSRCPLLHSPDPALRGRWPAGRGSSRVLTPHAWRWWHLLYRLVRTIKWGKFWKVIWKQQYWVNVSGCSYEINQWPRGHGGYFLFLLAPAVPAMWLTFSWITPLADRHKQALRTRNVC